MKEKKQYHYPVYIRDKEVIAGFYYHEILLMGVYFIALFFTLKLLGFIIASITLPTTAFLIHKKKDTRFTLLMELTLQIKYIFSERFYLKNERIEQEEHNEKRKGKKG